MYIGKALKLAAAENDSLVVDNNHAAVAVVAVVTDKNVLYMVHGLRVGTATQIIDATGKRMEHCRDRERGKEEEAVSKWARRRAAGL